MAILCDNALRVLFKHGFCCNYPSTTHAHFDALITATGSAKTATRFSRINRSEKACFPSVQDSRLDARYTS
jgi:hypothetical protein